MCCIKRGSQDPPTGRGVASGRGVYRWPRIATSAILFYLLQNLRIYKAALKYRSFPSSWHQKLQSCFCRYSATHTHTRTQSSLLFCWWKISFSKHTHTHIDGSARVCVFAHCLHTFGAGTKSRAFLFAILYANSKYLCNKKHPPTHPN